MVFMKYCMGERLSASDAAADMFHIEFQKFIQEENFKVDQIYNTDESGLYWKGLLTGILTFEREKCAPRYKLSEECLMIMCCGNASGNDKVKLVVIRKAKKPLSFNGTEANCITVQNG
jgi:hypothetical protein